MRTSRELSPRVQWLYVEHQRLTALMFSKGLSTEEAAQLERVHSELDAFEVAEMNQDPRNYRGADWSEVG